MSFDRPTSGIHESVPGIELDLILLGIRVSEIVVTVIKVRSIDVVGMTDRVRKDAVTVTVLF